MISRKPARTIKLSTAWYLTVRMNSQAVATTLEVGDWHFTVESVTR